jgi:glutamate/tyrosine decarboxylase-like PLP-dependent enzyme
MDHDRSPGDPLDVEEFRRNGHVLVDRIAELLGSMDETPLFPPRVDPAALHALFAEPLPASPTELPKLFAELETKLLPYCTHVNHPGYFGLITPSPLPAGILADLLASALNQNLGAWTIGPSAVALERQTVRWLNDLIGWGAGAGGNLTSGGMTANFIAMKLARDWASNDDAQLSGTNGRMTAYTSDERHVSVDKSADAVGIGREKLRIIPSDDRFEMRVDALEAAIAADRRDGLLPACIVAMGGSTNTGAVDDFEALRRIADRERLWLHVDAAYGGGMLLAERYRGRLDGLHLADSVTIDPHKWFFAPLDVGAVLVKDERRLTRSFGLEPAYLVDATGREAERYNYYVHGFEQSRRFRGLKVWLGLKRCGTRQLGAWVDGNVDQARRLYELSRASKEFVPATEPRMSAVCVRYAPSGWEEPRLAALHARVARRVEESGRFWFGTTMLKGRTWFRVNPVNFRTRLEHMDELFEFLSDECDRAAREHGA